MALLVSVCVSGRGRGRGILYLFFSFVGLNVSLQLDQVHTGQSLQQLVHQRDVSSVVQDDGSQSRRQLADGRVLQV